MHDASYLTLPTLTAQGGGGEKVKEYGFLIWYRAVVVNVIEKEQKLIFNSPEVSIFIGIVLS